MGDKIQELVGICIFQYCQKCQQNGFGLNITHGPDTVV